MRRRAITSVLFVYKRSSYQVQVREKKDPRILELLRRGDPSVARMKAADIEHRAALDEAKAAAKALGVKATFRHRGYEEEIEGHDLIATLGGDGTLLWVSHSVGPGRPVIAFNSSPSHSVGYFCAGRKGSIEETLGRALGGKIPEVRLTRMEVVADGRVLTRRVLNDALVCHQNPAMTSRYLIAFKGKEEEHRSSGLWVGPAAGSTAAQRSAGGKVLPARSKKLQFVVREPYAAPGQRYAVVRGLVGLEEELSIRSKMDRGRIYLDGPHQVYEAHVGCEILFRRSREPLSLLGFPRAMAGSPEASSSQLR